MSGLKRNSIDDIINSTEGMQPARPGDGLYAKIEKRITAGYAAAKTIPLTKVSLAAACILLLVVLNVLLMTKHTAPSNRLNTKDDVQQVADYYGLTDNMGGI